MGMNKLVQLFKKETGNEEKKKKLSKRRGKSRRKSCYRKLQPQLINLHNKIKDEKDEKIEAAVVESEMISSEEEKITTERSKRKISKKRKKRRYTLPEWKLEPKDD